MDEWVGRREEKRKRTYREAFGRGRKNGNPTVARGTNGGKGFFVERKIGWNAGHLFPGHHAVSDCFTGDLKDSHHDVDLEGRGEVGGVGGWYGMKGG